MAPSGGTYGPRSGPFCEGVPLSLRAEIFAVSVFNGGHYEFQDGHLRHHYFE